MYVDRAFLMRTLSRTSSRRFRSFDKDTFSYYLSNVCFNCGRNPTNRNLYIPHCRLLVKAPYFERRRLLSTSKLEVWEYPVTKIKDEDQSPKLYTYSKTCKKDNNDLDESANTKATSTTTLWTVESFRFDRDGKVDNKSQSDDKIENVKEFSMQSLSLLLPAQYPKSVAPGYLSFASFCFGASVAGSAAMVLSTQTLLLAVGIVGQNVQQASIMAGAFNWVMKDFVGQLGGVIFASQMGKTRAFDSDPKRWRMVAAIALDSATLLEILSPLFYSSMVLPIASIANVGKNIGFLTASASRAALHQSLAISGNLGDVTAKAGSQAIMASLVGTSLGIGLSSLLQHDTFNFVMGFFFLSVMHQGCNFLSLQHVPLAHFNTQRLSLVLEKYIREKEVLYPTDVAKMERFLPFLQADFSKDWLHVGRPVNKVCPDPEKFEKLLGSVPGEEYLIHVNQNTQKIDILYFKDASGEHVIRGMYHVCLLREAMKEGNLISDTQVYETHKIVETQFAYLFEQLQGKGWNTASDVTTVESSTAYRININNR